MNYIYEIENSLSSEVCKDIIARFDKDDRRHPGYIGNNIYNETIKKSTDLCITGLSEWKDIDDILSKALSDGLSKYYTYLLDKIELRHFNYNLKDEGYQIQCSEKGGFYRWHNDDKMNFNRVISCIWYLNTLELDDGGTTDFICGKSIKPVEGKLLLFPATWTYIHCGKPVNKNKYICVTFLFDDEET
jgi:hypothetical protein